MNQNENRSLVILTQTPSRYLEFERFLLGRGWRMKMQNDLKRFLEDVTFLKPAYALISIDFDTSKLPHLSQLLEQVYRVKIIRFAETESVANWDKLRQLPPLSRLMGSLTGPAFERLLVSIAQSREGKESPKNKKLHLQYGALSLMKKQLKSQGQRMVYPLTKSNKVLCYQVLAEEFSGHFLVVTGGQGLDSDIQMTLRSALESLIQGLYDCATCPPIEIYEVEIPGVDFKNFAAQTAEFLVSGLHLGAEVAMAFFEVPQDWAFLDKKSSFVALDFVQECIKQASACSLYLYLPLNDKFILYLGEGQFLDPKQEINLQNYGITRLYARQDDLPKVYQRHMQSRYSDMILQFASAA